MQSGKTYEMRPILAPFERLIIAIKRAEAGMVLKTRNTVLNALIEDIKNETVRDDQNF